MARAYVIATLIDLTCEGCGKSFQRLSRRIRTPRTYCSRACYYPSSRHRVIRYTACQCRFCGKDFTVPSSKLKKSLRGLFCSRKCRDADSLSKRVTIACAQCGKPRTMPPCREDRKYCSNKCLYAAQRRRFTFACEGCGEQFTRRRSVVERATPRFCSRACWEAPERKKASTEIRFWQNVRKTKKCWLWIGPYMSNAYGHMSVGNKRTGAHRYSYELHYGPIPKGLFICHKCDNKQCVRPSHLFAGTHKENMDDMRQKQRAKKTPMVLSAPELHIPPQNQLSFRY